MAELLKGKPVVDRMAEDMRGRIASLEEQGVKPTLALVRLGQRPDDLSYERTAVKRAAGLGIHTKPYVLDEFAPEAALKATLQSINYDKTVHGCLMFRPLPTFMDEKAMCNTLTAAKDVDGISLASLAAVFTDAPDGFPPCTAAACVAILEHYKVPIAGKHVVVIGRSLVVGKPAAMMLLGKNATVTICHTKTRDVQAVAREADILVSAAGVLKSLTKDYVRPGQIVIDVSMNWDPDKVTSKGKGGMAGDAVFAEVEPIVEAITPVPGGVGAVTTSVLIGHVVEAAERTLA